MVWIEMSRDEIHGGQGWGFAECLWSPVRKKSGGKWPFWDNLLSVEAGDAILHLKGIRPHANFVGISYAQSDGHITSERPEFPGEWGYSDQFNRVFLKDFVALPAPINLDQLFESKRNEFETYLNTLSGKKKNIFFTKQAGKLQCLNGAYLSLADDKLVAIIIDEDIADEPITSPQHICLQSNTSESWGKTKQRIGHASFARNVKANYNYKCCFPGCEVDNRHYLIASHIARWVDNPERRGDTSNGLCLCVLHDKAFEIGDFSVDDEYNIIARQSSHSVFQYNISPFIGERLRCGSILPSIQALKEHRIRNGYTE